MKTGKLIIKGKIRLCSPAMIGSGKSENTDMDLIRDSQGMPFIPATSFVGVLRHSLDTNILGEDKRDKIERFWGTKEKKNPEELFQSALFCRDLLPSDNTMTEVSVRDGIRICNKKGIAQHKSKFDFEVIERDTTFDLHMEIELLKGYEDLFKQMLATIIHVLKGEKIRIGAKTNSGFGMIRLSEFNVYEFDFNNKQDVMRWLKKDLSCPVKLDAQPLEKIEKKKFEINATFSIKNSLIVRSYTADIDRPDAEHIMSKGNPILPGTSLKGAIRSRAERILNTLQKPQDILLRLFGNVDEEKKEAYKGKITVDESILPPYPAEIQARIKIDRFTGGVMEGALLETMPLFRGRDEQFFHIKITINDYEDYEAGLMLLILKDLWTGDLPIGGEKAIGRGVLKGRSAEIRWQDNEVRLKEDITELSSHDKDKLQRFVDALINHGG